MTRRHNVISGKKVFIHLTDTWYIQYEYIEIEGLFKYGLRLRYKNRGTSFKYIRSNSISYKSELEMKKAIKSDVSKWLIKTQKEYDVKEIPLGQVQELVSPQLTLFD